jgi:hypothetical protein
MVQYHLLHFHLDSLYLVLAYSVAPDGSLGLFISSVFVTDILLQKMKKEDDKYERILS